MVPNFSKLFLVMRLNDSSITQKKKEDNVDG